MAGWDRQEKEPPRAYHYFTLYRDLGPSERSLPRVSQIASVSVPRLKDLSEQYNWVARCDQWDAHVKAIHDRAFLAEVSRRGKKRGDAFAALLDKSLEALNRVDLAEVSLAQVAQALKVAAEGMRLEEGLETQRVTMEVTDARTVLSTLPAEIRGGILRALAKDARSGAATSAAGGIPFGIGEPGEPD